MWPAEAQAARKGEAAPGCSMTLTQVLAFEAGMLPIYHVPG